MHDSNGDAFAFGGRRSYAGYFFYQAKDMFHYFKVGKMTKGSLDDDDSKLTRKEACGIL